MAKNASAKTFTLGLDVDGWYRSLPPSDITAPSLPTISSVVAQGQSSLLVTWNASSDAQSGVAGYRIEVDGVEVDPPGVVTTTGTSYLATGFSAGSTHTFKVAAIDNAGNDSGFGSSAVGTTAASSGAVNIKPLHYDNFEGAAIDEDRWNIQDDWDTAYDSGPAISTNRSRSGSKSCRVQLTFTRSSGTLFTRNGNSASATESGHRSELNSNKAWAVTGDNGRTVFNREYWYGCSIYIPDAGDAFGDPEMVPAPNPWHIFLQWHGSASQYTATAQSVTSTTVVLPSSASAANNYYTGSITIGGQTRNIASYTGGTRTVTVTTAFSPTPSAGTFTIKEQSLNPPLSLGASGQSGGNGTNRDRWQIQTLSQSAEFSPRTYTTNVIYDAGDWTDDKGKWTDWIFRVVWSYTAGSGILQVWKDGVLVVSRINLPNAYNDSRAPYAIPIGFYTQKWNPQTQTPPTHAPGLPEKRVAYWDNWIHAEVTGNSLSAAVDTSNEAYIAIANFVANGNLPA